MIVMTIFIMYFIHILSILILKILRNYDSCTGMDETKKTRYEEVKKVGEEIIGLVKECQKLFQASEDSVHWHAYLDFIEGIIKSGKI